MSDLLAELSRRAQAEVEAAWNQELQARICSYESGEAKLVPAADVFLQARHLTQ